MARASVAHPCSTIVRLQPPEPSLWQVPEAWAGALTTARILFVSSNPSISEDGDHQSGDVAEDYPRGDWSDDDITDFVIHRFDSSHGWATSQGRFRRQDGSLSPRVVQFWARVRKRAAELLGEFADPAGDYAMTEVVHCKSKGERGVRAAVDHCAAMHLDRIVAASPAPVVVVLGAKARQQTIGLWHLPAWFGQHGGKGPGPDDDLAVRTIGGRPRVVAFLTHPTGMTTPQTFADTYPSRLADLRDVVSGKVAAGDFVIGRTTAPVMPAETTDSPPEG